MVKAAQGWAERAAPGAVTWHMHRSLEEGRGSKEGVSKLICWAPEPSVTPGELPHFLKPVQCGGDRTMWVLRRHHPSENTHNPNHVFLRTTSIRHPDSPGKRRKKRARGSKQESKLHRTSSLGGIKSSTLTLVLEITCRRPCCKTSHQRKRNIHQ